MRAGCFDSDTDGSCVRPNQASILNSRLTDWRHIGVRRILDCLPAGLSHRPDRCRAAGNHLRPWPCREETGIPLPPKIAGATLSGAGFTFVKIALDISTIVEHSRAMPKSPIELTEAEWTVIKAVWDSEP